MRIIGIDNMTHEELSDELFRGGRDVTVEVLNSLRQGSVAPDGHGIE